MLIQWVSGGAQESVKSKNKDQVMLIFGEIWKLLKSTPLSHKSGKSKPKEAKLLVQDHINKLSLYDTLLMLQTHTTQMHMHTSHTLPN